MVNGAEFEYLDIKKEFRVGDIKNIAVPVNNTQDIKKMYPGANKIQSNADMLSQSFSSEPQITPIPNNSIADSTVIPSISEPVQLTGIPTTGVSNLESTPVSLDINVPNVPTNSDIAMNNNNSEVAPVINNLPQTEISNGIVENNVAPTLDVSSTVPNQSIGVNTPVVEAGSISTQPVGIDSGFKVSDAPNIFDNPISPISQEEINTPLDNQSEIKPPLVEQNLNNDMLLPKQEKLTDNVNSDIKKDLIEAEIAILENDIKHYEGLAENSRKKIELLNKQLKKEKNDVNLENTASNLFNNNGVLDDEKVLGLTPLPNLKVA